MDINVVFDVSIAAQEHTFECIAQSEVENISQETSRNDLAVAARYIRTGVGILALVEHPMFDEKVATMVLKKNVGDFELMFKIFEKIYDQKFACTVFIPALKQTFSQVKLQVEETQTALDKDFKEDPERFDIFLDYITAAHEVSFEDCQKESEKKEKAFAQIRAHSVQGLDSIIKTLLLMGEVKKEDFDIFLAAPEYFSHELLELMKNKK